MNDDIGENNVKRKTEIMKAGVLLAAVLMILSAVVVDMSVAMSEEENESTSVEDDICYPCCQDTDKIKYVLAQKIFITSLGARGLNNKELAEYFINAACSLLNVESHEVEEELVGFHELFNMPVDQKTEIYETIENAYDAGDITSKEKAILHTAMRLYTISAIWGTPNTPNLPIRYLWWDAVVKVWDVSVCWAQCIAMYMPCFFPWCWTAFGQCTSGCGSIIGL